MSVSAGAYVESPWKAANKLRSNMDAAEYTHVVLELIFLKYISDSFEEMRARMQNPADDLIQGGCYRRRYCC